MLVAIIYKESALNRISFSFIEDKISLNDFLQTCTEDMVLVYSHALERVKLKLSSKEVVRASDYDHSYLGLVVMECEDESAHIYTEYTESDLQEGERQIDITMPIKDLYFEMHEFTSLLRLLRQSYSLDRSKVFGMDLSENFSSLDNARYFNTKNGESGMITDIPEGRAWLEKERAEQS